MATTLNKAYSIPPLNTLRFIPANKVLPVGYNTYPFDQGFFWQKIRTFFQTPVAYYQKILVTDAITVYFDLLATEAKILILDSTGATVFDSGVFAYTDSAAGYVDDHFGDQFYTYVSKFTLNDLGIGDGFYYVVIQAIYAGDAEPLKDTLYVAECIQVMESWEKTILLEYANSDNDYDVFFEPASTPVPWGFRVEGDIEMLPAGHTVEFEDMFYQMQKLQDVPYRIGNLTIGGEGGVPVWVHDKVNRILSCDTFTIDGVVWKKETGSTWSWKKADNYPMLAATITLRDNPEQSEWQGNNSDDPGTFIIHDDVFDDTHD